MPNAALFMASVDSSFLGVAALSADFGIAA